MATSAQKSASTSQVNLQGLQPSVDATKVPAPDAFTGERGKLRAFLAKLELYIGFNQAKFKSEMDKGLFTVSYLKDAAFDWVDPKLHEFLDKSPRNDLTIRNPYSATTASSRTNFEEPSG